MKKLYFHFLCPVAFFLLGELSFAQVTLIPDPGFEQLLINKGYDDLPDGQVLTDNLNMVFMLYIDVPVTDLTGIQDFANLHVLHCYDNNLTYLDVSNLQHLETLNCGKNSLTYLNVAGLPNLKTLVIGENPLTSVNLTGLGALEELNMDLTSITQLAFDDTNVVNYISAYGAALTALDVTNLPLLEVLVVSENNLSSLAVTGISPLRYLACSNNSLSSLDVSGTHLTDLYCNRNQLTALDLKGQSAMNSFNFTNNPSLYCIEVDDVDYFNSYPSWYKDTVATYRSNCNVTVVPDDNFEQALISLGYDDVMDDAVSNTSIAGITSLNISGQGIFNLTGIEGFTSLTDLNCSNNSVTGYALAGLTNLIKLNCSNNTLMALDVSDLTQLEELDFSGSLLYSNVVFGNNTALKKLNCSNTGHYSLDLGGLTALENLDCSQNNLSSLDLQNNNNLKSLDCSYNGISNVSFSANHPLEYMRCNNNNLFRVETFNLPNLKELKCNNNGIYDMDLRNLAQIEHIDISHNQISSFWINTLPNLQTFRCSDNYISKLQLSAFEELTELDCRNNNLTFLNLKGTAITNLDCTGNTLDCISMDTPEITIDNPNFQKDAAAVFAESCQTGPFTLIPDINFEKVLLNEAYDETLDGKAATNVIANISFLSLYLAGVSDLTGIQDFTSLSVLDLQANNLENLDKLAGMSSLSRLFCSENPFVNLDLNGLALTGVETFYCTDSTLETINFGDGMPNLTEAYLYENQLTTLDLSTLQNLYMVECYANKLENLNITGLQNLEEIDCSNNLLTSIDLSGVSNLGSINCIENEITALDFSQTPNIYSIDCSDNHIAQLDLSGLSNLYTLECNNNMLTGLDLSDAVNLESLYCNDNLLASLELTSNYIYDVECSGNRLTALDLSNVGGIDSVYCNDNQLVSLTLHPSIRYVGCENNFLTSLDLSNTENLSGINADSNYLASLDLTSPAGLYYFSALNNNYLKCIKVNDVQSAESNPQWTINGDSYFAVLCNSCPNTALWNETQWIPAAPDGNSIAFVKGALTITEDMDFCSLVILENAALNVPSGKNIRVSGMLEVDPTASLVLENNANLVQSGNLDENKGGITVKRDAVMRRLDYVYWASPVKDMNLFDFSDQTLPNRFYTLNEATNQFVWVNPVTTGFLSAHGYMIRAANTFPPNGSLATFTGIFNGAPHNAAIDVEVFHTEGKGFNLIGNPYPSTIDADAFMAANPDIDALYFWTHASQNPNSSNYATYNASGGAQAATTSPDAEPNGTIQIGQGFLARMTAAAAPQTTVHFTNAMRVANNENQFYRSGATIEKNRFWLNLSDTDKRLSQLLTGYITNATNGVDSRFDATLIETGGSKLYNLIENSEYVIQAKALPFTANDIVALGFKAEAAGNFSISLDHADGLFTESQPIYIKDNLTGAIHDIKQSDYGFASEAGTFNSRFEIVYELALGVGNPDKSHVVIFGKNQLTIDSGSETMQEIRIFDLSGRLIYGRKQVGSNNVQLTDFKVQQQALLVQVILEGHKTITKKVLY